MGHKKRKEKNIWGYITVAVITIAAVCALSLWTGAIRQRNNRYEEKEKRLETELEQESSYSDELNKQYDYVKTDDYVKDIAHAQFGLIEDGDMLVKPN